MSERDPYSKQQEAIYQAPARLDGTDVVGDMGGMPEVDDNSEMPCREAPFPEPTLGNPNAPARIAAGMMTAGQPVHGGEPSQAREQALKTIRRKP